MLDEYVRTQLSLARYLHSVRTAETTILLCTRFAEYGHFEDEAWTAGIAHDLAREWKSEEIFAAVSRDGLPISNFEKKNPMLLHGRAAAFVLRTSFDERREAVLQAVRRHTCGHPDMGSLGMMLYAADYIEPGRSHIDPSHAESLIGESRLENMVLRILREEFRHLERKGRRIEESSRLLYASLEKSVARSGVH